MPATFYILLNNAVRLVLKRSQSDSQGQLSLWLYKKHQCRQQQHNLSAKAPLFITTLLWREQYILGPDQLCVCHCAKENSPVA